MNSYEPMTGQPGIVEQVEIRMRECRECGQAAPEGMPLVHDKYCSRECTR